jgi:hypothetical protein
MSWWRAERAGAAPDSAAAHVALCLALLAGSAATEACGGKLLTLPATGDDASADDDGAIGAGSGGASTSSSSGSYGDDADFYYSSSSGSSGDDGSSGSGSFGSSSGPPTNACLSAADCATGLVCCATVDLATACQLGPCPETEFGPIQLCASRAECYVHGDYCVPLTIAPETPITECRAPPGGIDASAGQVPDAQ